MTGSNWNDFALTVHRQGTPVNRETMWRRDNLVEKPINYKQTTSEILRLFTHHHENLIATRQAPKKLLQALVELIGKCQSLKTAWQGDSLQALVEPISKCQALKTAWQDHSLQALVEIGSKSQALKTTWQCHFLQPLVAKLAECQALKTARKRHSLQALVEP